MQLEAEHVSMRRLATGVCQVSLARANGASGLRFRVSLNRSGSCLRRAPLDSPLQANTSRRAQLDAKFQQTAQERKQKGHCENTVTCR